MRAAQIVRNFVEWRWAPCVALTVGSLAYVGLALLFIPSQIEGGSSSADSRPMFSGSSALPNTAFASSLTQTSVATTQFALRDSMHRAPPPAAATGSDPGGVPRRGFSPPIDQPDPPPPPAMQAPVPPPQPVVNIPPPVPPPEQAAPAPVPPASAPAGDDAQQQPQ